jgi:hypothetical protein
VSSTAVAELVANALVLLTEAACCSPKEEFDDFEAPNVSPKLELSDLFEAFEVLAPKAELLVRFAEAFREPLVFEEELPSLELFELVLPAMPVPAVAAVEPLLPVVLEPFDPLVDGFANDVLLAAVEVLFLLPVDEAYSPALDELEEPWLAFAPLAVVARLPEAARLSLALTAPLDVWDDEAACCPPTVLETVSVDDFEAPALELSVELKALLSVVAELVL